MSDRSPVAVKRKRGRPPKAKPVAEANNSSAQVGGIASTSANINRPAPDSQPRQVEEMAGPPNLSGADRQALGQLPAVIPPAVIPPARMEMQLNPGALSTSTTSSRKRRLLLEAAEERARMKRNALAERERVELELVNERLAAEMEEDSDGSNSRVSVRRPHPSEEGRRAAQVAGWLANVAQQQQDPIHEPHGTGAPAGAGAAAEITQALTQTLEVIREASARDRATQQVVNRLTSAKSLPTFSGDSLEWLRFKQAYELSSRVGAYSPEENVARLFEALKSDAREAVDSLILTAGNAEVIMKTLELRFGNADRVLERIVQGLESLPKIITGGTDIVTFATKVRNAVSAMQALKHLGYLHSPTLTRGIVDKMPSALVYQYNHHLAASPNEEPRLVNLANFLYKEAELACRHLFITATRHLARPARRTAPRAV